MCHQVGERMMRAHESALIEAYNVEAQERGEGGQTNFAVEIT